MSEQEFYDRRITMRFQCNMGPIIPDPRCLIPTMSPAELLADVLALCAEVEAEHAANDCDTPHIVTGDGAVA
jgi:hypothetical protein